MLIGHFVFTPCYVHRFMPILEMNYTNRFVAVLSVFVTSLLFADARADDLETGGWTNLIDAELSQWEVLSLIHI